MSNVGIKKTGHNFNVNPHVFDLTYNRNHLDLRESSPF